MLLVTGNRNEESPESLQATIVVLNRADSLPVITIADKRRIQNDKAYAEEAADRLLAIVFDIENFLGAGRLFIP